MRRLTLATLVSVAGCEVGPDWGAIVFRFSEGTPDVDPALAPVLQVRVDYGACIKDHFAADPPGLAPDGEWSELVEAWEERMCGGDDPDRVACRLLDDTPVLEEQRHFASYELLEPELAGKTLLLAPLPTSTLTACDARVLLPPSREDTARLDDQCWDPPQPGTFRVGQDDPITLQTSFCEY